MAETEEDSGTNEHVGNDIVSGSSADWAMAVSLLGLFALIGWIVWVIWGH